SKVVKGRDVIERISLESFNNSVAPLFVGITAELVAGDGSPQPTSSTAGREEVKSGGLPSAIATGPAPASADAPPAFDIRWSDVTDAELLPPSGGQPERIALELTPAKAQEFREFTANNVGKTVQVKLNGVVRWVPKMAQAIATSRLELPMRSKAEAQQALQWIRAASVPQSGG